MTITSMNAGNPTAGQAHRNADPVNIAVWRKDVLKAAENHNGLTFKGFGVLSGNATSSLLLDYKAEHPSQYWRLLRVLFGRPNPMMTLVKIEMGNDRNTSTGPEPAVMRTADEYPDVAREPGFQLASDAKRFQPDLHVSILRWCHPAWVGSDESFERIYRWYKNTILAVYRRYGYMVDSVNPGVNERPANLGWAREFAKRVRRDETGFEGAGKILDLAGNPVPAWKDAREKHLFHRIRIIVSDEVSTGTCGTNLVRTAPNRTAVDIASFHYNTADDANGSYTRLAEKFDKQVWNSEAQATFSLTGDRPDSTMSPISGEGPGRLAPTGARLSAGTGIGGINGPLEMANTIIRGFLSSRRTMFIYQPAVSAFYDGSQYSSKELVALHFPWNGYINWDGALAVLRQFSAFCHAGFEDCTPADGSKEDSLSGSSFSRVSSPANFSADHPQRVWRCIPQASCSTLSDGNPPGRGAGENSARGGCGQLSHACRTRRVSLLDGDCQRLAFPAHLSHSHQSSRRSSGRVAHEGRGTVPACRQQLSCPRGQCLQER